MPRSTCASRPTRPWTSRRSSTREATSPTRAPRQTSSRKASTLRRVAATPRDTGCTAQRDTGCNHNSRRLQPHATQAAAPRDTGCRPYATQAAALCDADCRPYATQALIQEQRQHPRWGSYAEELLSGAFLWPRDGGHDDSAHPPIHPVKDGAGLDGDDARLYEMVARRFLACCGRNAEGFETVVKVPCYRARGLTPSHLACLRACLLGSSGSGSGSDTAPSTAHSALAHTRYGTRRSCIHMHTLLALAHLAHACTPCSRLHTLLTLAHLAHTCTPCSHWRTCAPCSLCPGRSRWRGRSSPPRG